METHPEIIQTGPLIMSVGPIVLFIIIFVTLLLFSLLFLGLRAKIKRRDYAVYSWWIHAITIWMLIFGITNFAFQAVRTFGNMLGFVRSSVLFDNLTEIFIHLFLPSAVSLLGLTFNIILGSPIRKKLK